MSEKKNKDHNQKMKKKKSMSFSIKKHGLIVIIALNIGLVLINILVLTFLSGTVDSVVQTRSEILAQELQIQSAQKLISDLNATEEERIVIESTLPTKSKLLDIIELFEGLDSTANVTRFTFESESPRLDAKGYPFLPISLTLEGSLSQTMNALQRLEQTPYIFLVKNTLINSPSGLGNNIVVQTTLNLYVRQPFNDD